MIGAAGVAKCLSFLALAFALLGSSSGLRSLQQAPPDDDIGTWPPDFTDSDRAAETQRIFRAVVAERNATATAYANPDQAWTDWLKEYNVSYASTEIASYRRSVFNYNLARAYQLNQLAGPDVAFGLNRFSVLTAEEFLARYTGDLQDDSGITVDSDNPRLISTPAAGYLAGLVANPPRNASSNTSSGGNGTAAGSAGNGTAGQPAGAAAGAPGAAGPGGAAGGGAGSLPGPGASGGAVLPPGMPGTAGAASPLRLTGYTAAAEGTTWLPVRFRSSSDGGGGMLPGAIAARGGPAWDTPAAAAAAPLGGATTLPASSGTPSARQAAGQQSGAPTVLSADGLYVGTPPPFDPTVDPTGIDGGPPMPVAGAGTSSSGGSSISSNSGGGDDDDDSASPGSDISRSGQGDGAPVLGGSTNGIIYMPSGGGMPGGRRRALLQQQQKAPRLLQRLWRAVHQALAMLLPAKLVLAPVPLPHAAATPWLARPPAGWAGSSGSGSSSSSHRRRLAQALSSPPARAPGEFCSREQRFPYADMRPFESVDWLRAGVVRPPKFQGNCSASFAFVAAALAEAAMALQGYNGTARDISEPQLLACMPYGSCARGGTTHVLLNYLACNGYAAVGNSFGDSFGAYPSSRTGTAADYGGRCANGSYHPVETGITGWSFVPPNEADFARALSRSPMKVSVDAALLQSYRAGFVGCNVLSRTANHALLAAGFNTQVRAARGAEPGKLNYTRGAQYWMLRNSWGRQGSVDGYVYVIKGCPRTAPLGLLLNRGVIALYNQTESYKVGRLQCEPDANANKECASNKPLLLRLSAFCAAAPDFLPPIDKTNCSCSCLPG